MRLRTRIIALALTAILTLSGVLLSPALSVSAAASDLYGTGSADEINIIKILDMALNKGGMSMSPATIKAFLDYWWSSVRADLSKCISNADSAITTTQAFADYVVSALENADHYDKLGSIMTKYVQYCLTLGAESVSDLKQLLTQEGTFRRFLLSYVVDEDGNIAGTVDNKLKKYNLKGGLVNMVRQAADAYIDEYEGYYLIKTRTPSELTSQYFASKFHYDYICGILKTIDDDMVVLLSRYVDSVYSYFFYDLSDSNFVAQSRSGDYSVLLDLYNDDWTASQTSRYQIRISNGIADPDEDITLSDIESKGIKMLCSPVTYMLGTDAFVNAGKCGWIYTKDGRSIKVWKSLEGFKASTVGHSDIYYSNNYSSYNAGVDNSIEFTGSYYSSTNNTYSHDVIQTSIDNSQETINESTVNNITNQTINNITNNYGSGSGTGSGDDSGGGWNLGEGIEAFVKGVAELLDFVLKLLGDLVGLLGRFLTDVLEVFKSLGLVGSNFGEFLKEVFGFLPPECISLIMSSIGAMCIVGVIKAFKK